jgi:hypothetical protein
MNMREYSEFLKRLVNLQSQLIQVLEEDVETVEILYDLPEQIKSKVNNIIRSYPEISRILRFWPTEVSRIPLHIWVTPKKGDFQKEEQSWHFDIHGFAQVSFIALSTEASEEVEIIKTDENNLVPGLPSTSNVEVTYLEGGRFDGISAWSVFQFTQTTNSKFGNLSQIEHEALLENLANEEVLQRWPSWGPGADRYYIFAPNS